MQLGCCGITFLISSKVLVSRKRSSQKQLLHAQSWIITKISQLLFAFKLEKVWNMFKYINKNTRKRQWRVSIVHFELVNFNWAVIVTISNLELFVMAQLNVDRNLGRREKINLNFYFHTSLLGLQRFYDSLKCLHQTFWGITKKYENKNFS